MARTKATAANANPMPRKGQETTPKPTDSRPAPAQNQVKKPGKQCTQPQPLASNSVASGRVKKGQTKPISKRNAKAPKKPSRHPDNDNFDPNQEYKTKGIIDEKGGKYLIRWAGKDSDGGDFVDSWVPKSFANKLARLDWALRVEQNRRNSFNESDSEEGDEEDEEEEVQGRGKQKRKTKATTKKSPKAGARKAKGKK
ncbi:hypothetical protein MBLNU13_g07910t1 [Cladosporium sp. NU13]